MYFVNALLYFLKRNKEISKEFPKPLLGLIIKLDKEMLSGLNSKLMPADTHVHSTHLLRRKRSPPGVSGSSCAGKLFLFYSA